MKMLLTSFGCFGVTEKVRRELQGPTSAGNVVEVHRDRPVDAWSENVSENVFPSVSRRSCGAHADGGQARFKSFATIGTITQLPCLPNRQHSPPVLRSTITVHQVQRRRAFETSNSGSARPDRRQANMSHRREEIDSARLVEVGLFHYSLLSPVESGTGENALGGNFPIADG